MSSNRVTMHSNNPHTMHHKASTSQKKAVANLLRCAVRNDDPAFIRKMNEELRSRDIRLPGRFFVLDGYDAIEAQLIINPRLLLERGTVTGFPCGHVLDQNGELIPSAATQTYESTLYECA